MVNGTTCIIEVNINDKIMKLISTTPLSLVGPKQHWRVMIQVKLPKYNQVNITQRQLSQTFDSMIVEIFPKHCIEKGIKNSVDFVQKHLLKNTLLGYL